MARSNPSSRTRKGETRRGPLGWLARRLPSSEDIRKSRLVAWLGPKLLHPRLWHLNRHSVALGVAVGLFFGLLIPLGQVPFAAVASLWLRANLPAALASTLVTNPLTYPPIYLLAYRIGSSVLGDPVEAAAAAELEELAEDRGLITTTWAERFMNIGKPLAIGLAVLACSAAPLAYFLVLVCWRLVEGAAGRKDGHPH